MIYIRCSELRPSPSQVGNGMADRSLARMNPEKRDRARARNAAKLLRQPPPQWRGCQGRHFILARAIAAAAGRLPS